ncbi:MAG TPA: tetratricopeptide repeat protein [Candidatus Paceibacterota bacterium]|nr:tetratricopeptide repeat protein [Candidatus Paceibacterota bacterium]
MYSPLVSWSRIVFLAGLVLALVLVIPAVWFPLQLGKIAVFAALLALTLILFIAGRGAGEFMRTHGWPLALMVGALPLAYLLSAYLAGSHAVSFTGIGVEVDTVVFTTLAFLAFILSFTFFKTLRTVGLLMQTVFWALTGVVVFQWLVIIFGTGVIPFEIFNDRSINLLGKWNDLGVATALLGVLLLIRAELTDNSPLKKMGLVVGTAILAILLGIVNFSLAWWFVLIASVVLGYVVFTSRRGDVSQDPYASQSWVGRISWMSVASAVIAIIFLLFGTSINNFLTGIFPVSSLEVRPSYSSTYDVIDSARGGSVKSALLGTGPNTFSDSWLVHKPAEVNQSQFWNLDFNVGFSTLLTALGTVGLIGVLAWLIPIALVLVALVRVIRLHVLSREEQVAAISVGIGSLVMLASLVLYVPSPNMVLLAFVLAGAAFGFMWRQGREGMGGEEFESSSSRIGSLGVLIVLLVLGLVAAVTIDRRFIAQAMTNQGIASLQNGNADDALARASSALGVEKTAESLRLRVEAGILKMQQIANSESASTPQAQEEFRKVAENTIAAGQELVAKSPNDYRSYTTLARIYDLLAALKVQGAFDSAKQSYETALTYNPNSPQIALSLAQLAARENNLQLTQQYLSQALTLKPNYTDAMLLVVQLNVANNDIPNAIRAAEAAVQTAPGVGPIWFQLGLLYYSNNNMANAAAALERAIQIVPDYANAKYFLGLAYYAQARSADAIPLFEDLARTNPESQEVALILSNMRSGKQPFDSVPPPANTPPQNRPTAPISE